MPFLIAPLLSTDDLDRVKYLHVTRNSLGPNHVTGYQVIGYDWVSPLQMHFTTADGATVHVDYGVASLRFVENGTLKHESVCSANATCSSFHVNGIDVDAKKAEMLRLLDEVANSVRFDAPPPSRPRLDESPRR